MEQIDIYGAIEEEDNVKYYHLQDIWLVMVTI